MTQSQNSDDVFAYLIHFYAGSRYSDFVDFIIWTYHFSKVSITPKIKNRNPQKKPAPNGAGFLPIHFSMRLEAHTNPT